MKPDKITRLRYDDCICGLIQILEYHIIFSNADDKTT